MCTDLPPLGVLWCPLSRVVSRGAAHNLLLRLSVAVVVDRSDRQNGFFFVFVLCCCCRSERSTTLFSFSRVMLSIGALDYTLCFSCCAVVDLIDYVHTIVFLRVVMFSSLFFSYDLSTSESLKNEEEIEGHLPLFGCSRVLQVLFIIPGTRVRTKNDEGYLFFLVIKFGLCTTHVVSSRPLGEENHTAVVPDQSVCSGSRGGVRRQVGGGGMSYLTLKNKNKKIKNNWTAVLPYRWGRNFRG